MSVESTFSKARLEAFSDGVMSVIITILVLDLRPPQTDAPSALAALWPSFLIYFVSFSLTAIYWINHHSLMTQVRRVTTGLLWTNIAVLFCASLIPFATAYVAKTRVGSFSTAVYATLQFVNALAFMSMFKTIEWQRDDEPFRRGAAVRRRWNRAAILVYAAAIVMASIQPHVAIALLAVVAVAYVAPTFLDARMPS